MPAASTNAQENAPVLVVAGLVLVVIGVALWALVRVAAPERSRTLLALVYPVTAGLGGTLMALAGLRQLLGSG